MTSLMKNLLIKCVICMFVSTVSSIGFATEEGSGQSGNEPAKSKSSQSLDSTSKHRGTGGTGN
jgi:hypothetical protein